MFEKNLEFINNAELKAKLEGLSLDVTRRDISYCMTKSNDYLLLKHDVPLDDINDPRAAIVDMLNKNIKQTMGSSDIIVTFGIGLCYLLDETFNRYPSRIFVYEPDLNLLHFVLNNVDISEHLQSGRVFIFNDLNHLIKKLAEIYITKDKVEVVYLKNYAVLRNNDLLMLTQKVYETCKSKMVDVNTINKFSKTWLVNTLKNISYINSVDNVYSILDLERKYTGQTALIIGAGPSLSENIEKIKANRNNYVIFAVNKVLRTLEANGITPDFAVCLDATHIKKTLAGLDEFCKKINCIMDLKSDPVVFEKKFKKYFLTFSASDFVIKKLGVYNEFIQAYEGGGSATTLAMVAAIKLGFCRIIFTGLDLAFKDDILYSTGETIKKVSERQITIGAVKKDLVKVKSVTGCMVQTREDYAAFIQHFQMLLKDLNYTSVYNTTSFGAYIEGMKYQPLDSIEVHIPATKVETILLDVRPIEFKLEDWSVEELKLINDVIAMVSRGIFSPALVSAIVKSSLLYQYMQADVLQVLQKKFEPSLAEDFMQKTKDAIKEIVELLQKYRLI